MKKNKLLMACVISAAFVIGVPQINKATTHQASKRSSEWPSIRKHHLIMEPRCAWCKCKCTCHLQVHHIQPFHEHPELELEDSNLITLCECPTSCADCSEYLCHLKHGHLGDFKKENPNIRNECNDRWKEKK